VLDNPLGVVHGDGFIIRDQSATRTIGGGHVIDIFPPTRRRSSEPRLALLRALDTSDHEAALTAAMATEPDGVDLAKFGRARNLADAELQALKTNLTGKIIGAEGQQRVFSEPHWRQLRDTIVATLNAWHEKHADQVGLADVPLLRQAGYRYTADIAQAVGSALEKEGTIVRERLGLRLPTHQAGLQGADAALWQKIESTVEADGLRPGSLADIAGRISMPERRLQSFLTSAGRHGLVHRISNTRYLTRHQFGELQEIATATAASHAGKLLEVRAFRDASGIGRNMSIEVLEYFDKIGFTARRGEAREIKT
jgi:selenocysteine-specific elongation factor